MMMNNNIAYWNIRGGHLSSKQSEVKKLIKEQKIQLIAISETKLNKTKADLACKNIAPDWSYEENLQSAPYGRILVLWNSDVFKMTKLQEDDKIIHFSAISLPSNTSFLISFVYAKNNLDRRLSFSLFSLLLLIQIYLG